MAIIKGLRGLRFTPAAGEISELCCPPYDVISDGQRREYLSRNPHNVIRLELPKEGADPYAEAARVLNEWLDGGILTRDEESLYLYEEEFSANGERVKVKGLICRVRLEEFEKGVILPHESTLSKAKEDRLSLMKATGCNFSQIYSLYMDEDRAIRPRVDALSSGAPQVEFPDADGVVHRLWQVTDQAEIAAISEAFLNRKLFIADGHHRYETGLNYRDYMRSIGKAREGDGCDYIMMMLVEMENEGLRVLPTHRLIRGLNGFSRDSLISAASRYFEVQTVRFARRRGLVGRFRKNTSEEDRDPAYMAEKALRAYYDKNQTAFVLYSGGDSFDLLILRDNKVMSGRMPGCSEALRNLDVSVLHTLLLEDVLGIDKANMADQTSLTYVKLAGEAIAAVRAGEAQGAFILNPTRVSEIRDVAAAGEKMPQKSTYFYPKLITGLVMNQLD